MLGKVKYHNTLCRMCGCFVGAGMEGVVRSSGRTRRDDDKKGRISVHGNLTNLRIGKKN